MNAVLAAILLLPLFQHPSGYLPQRVYDARGKGFTDFESMLADLSRADAVFVGEQHDDPNTHRLELAIVEGLMRRQVPVVVALEMFERDVQVAVDRYTSDDMTEDEFLKVSRPWPRYASDYRPLIEFAKAHNLHVVASNVPRRIAASVSKNGLSAVDALGADRAHAAKDLSCPPSGSYFDRFAAAMGTHSDASPNFYFAQCVKDETMGEAVAAAFEQASPRRVTIVHVNGAFHSDFREGTADSARRRMPGRRIAVVSVLPVADIDGVKPSDDDLKRADYLLYTVGKKQ